MEKQEFVRTIWGNFPVGVVDVAAINEQYPVLQEMSSSSDLPTDDAADKPVILYRHDACFGSP